MILGKLSSMHTKRNSVHGCKVLFDFETSFWWSRISVRCYIHSDNVLKHLFQTQFAILKKKHFQMKLDLIVGIYMYIKWIISGYGRNYVHVCSGKQCGPLLALSITATQNTVNIYNLLNIIWNSFIMRNNCTHNLSICQTVKRGGGYKEIIFELEWNKNEALRS